ncbi:MAG: hypothetical protein FWE91_12405 [Defluviitaleaceae bacterium]|nr:hypothetical protein [Defluviitaleaceae bacterium]MCL2836649.1 hypothetical protein [Defluviitaleaceae bacterium]
MMIYDAIMLALVAVSIGVLIGAGYAKGKGHKACTIKKTDLDKPGLADEDFEHISKTCSGWYRVSKFWCCIHYSLSVYAVAASIITVYIATSEDFAVSAVVLYSIISLVCTVTSLILRCDTKTIIIRSSFNMMQTMIYKCKMGKCTVEDLIDCFDECERRITEFYI